MTYTIPIPLGSVKYIVTLSGSLGVFTFVFTIPCSLSPEIKKTMQTLNIDKPAKAC